MESRHAEQNVLLFYLVYERFKGPASFFAPYFDSVDQPEVTYFWDDKVLDLLLDSEFKTQLYETKKRLTEEYDTYKKIIELYP